MNRREFAQSALATAGLGSIAMAEIEKPNNCDESWYWTAILFPTGVQFPEGVNVAIVPPQAAAVLASYTAHDRNEKGDQFGLTWFHKKHVVQVDSLAAAKEYYHQLDGLGEWVPCIVRLPRFGECDVLEHAVHCLKHEKYKPLCRECRAELDNHPSSKSMCVQERLNA